MKTSSCNRTQHQQGSALVAYFVIMLVTVSAIAALGAYVAQSSNLANRRSDLIAAREYATGGAVIGCADLNGALTNRSGTLASNLLAKGYTLDSAQSSSSEKVYQRNISSLFSNQTVKSQIRLPASIAPTSGKIVASAKTGKVTQTATVNIKMAWAYPGAIISVNPGTTATKLDAATGKQGNVVVNATGLGTIIVDGGPGYAILANGRANIDNQFAKIPAAAISMTNYNSANEIPDYTAQGTANMLFDFARFIAVAKATPNVLNTNSGNNHFTNLLQFLIANKKAAATPAKALEGVIVVDILLKDKTKDVGLDVLDNPAAYPQHLPGTNGITVRGTLFFNFGPAWGPLDKAFNLVPMNINPANLAGLVATNPATYPSGYPPVYHDPSKNPININITSKGFENFTADDDLPAVMYSMGTLDMHGPANVCGVLYTPSYVEIENRPNETGFANQLQYFRGSLIMGMGIYYENNKQATSIISFDPRTLDSLTTTGTAGKQMVVTYWE